jgi:hypothetical protein
MVQPPGGCAELPGLPVHSIDLPGVHPLQGLPTSSGPACGSRSGAGNTCSGAALGEAWDGLEERGHTLLT